MDAPQTPTTLPIAKIPRYPIRCRGRRSTGCGAAPDVIGAPVPDVSELEQRLAQFRRRIGDEEAHRPPSSCCWVSSHVCPRRRSEEHTPLTLCESHADDADALQCRVKPGFSPADLPFRPATPQVDSQEAGQVLRPRVPATTVGLQRWRHRVGSLACDFGTALLAASHEAMRVYIGVGVEPMCAPTVVAQVERPPAFVLNVVVMPLRELTSELLGPPTG